MEIPRRPGSIAMRKLYGAIDDSKEVAFGPIAAGDSAATEVRQIRAASIHFPLRTRAFAAITEPPKRPP